MPTDTTTNEMRESVSGITDTAKRTLSDVTGQVGQKSLSIVDQQRETTVAGLTSVADAVRRMGEGLREQQNGPMAQYAARYGDTLAGQVERAASYLREHDARQVVTDIESFARRKPMWFIGGAFLLGIAGTRFLKSSSGQGTEAAASGGASMLPVDYADTPTPSPSYVEYDLPGVSSGGSPFTRPTDVGVGLDDTPETTRTPGF